MTVTQQWHLRGEYLESCNCEVLCPCGVPESPQVPTEGHRDMALVFRIEDGEIEAWHPKLHCRGLPQ